jgi:glycosyltransferase involved in cell wall biosynthesis
VDDHSSDKTFQRCEAISKTDPRIKLIRNERNLGMMQNWNCGLNLCHSDYFVKLDADDWWGEKMIESCLAVLDECPDVGLVFSRYAEVNASNEIAKESSGSLPVFARNRGFYGIDLVKQGIHKMLSENVLRQGIGLIRRRIFEELGPFLLHDSGDIEMWFRIVSRYKAYGMDEIFYYYRTWPENFTRTQVIAMGKQEKNLYELRTLIVRYYVDQKLLSETTGDQFLEDNQYEYNKHRIYKYRTEGNWKDAIRVFFKNLFLKPSRTIGFYFGRLTINRRS